MLASYIILRTWPKLQTAGKPTQHTCDEMLHDTGDTICWIQGQVRQL